MPEAVAVNGKVAIRDFMNGKGMERSFTDLQAIVYGPEINRAEVFEGFLEFLEYYFSFFSVFKIISHRTKYPINGAHFDLHQAAADFFYQAVVREFGSDRFSLEFYETKMGKVEAITKESCQIFLDDLPEILKMLPERVESILFGRKINTELLEGINHSVLGWPEFHQKCMDGVIRIP